MPKKSTSKDFWGRVAVKSPGDCWEWTGAKQSVGYGTTSLNGNKRTLAHRMAWITCFGEIETGLDVAHKCANKLCVNPSHLYLSSRAENNREHVFRNDYTYPMGGDGITARAIKFATAENARNKIASTNYDVVSDDVVVSILDFIQNSDIALMLSSQPIASAVMPCGHNSRYVASSFEGTQFCVMCEYQALAAVMRKIKKALDI